MVWNTIINSKSQTLLSDFFFGGRAAVHRLTRSRFLLNSLGWDNLSVRRAKQKANLMYKCINNLAPAYLCNLFAPKTPNYYFRNAREEKINAPKTKN